MNDNIYKEWYEAIDVQNIGKKAKYELKRHVKKILDSNGVVVLNIMHLAQLVNINREEIYKMLSSTDSYYRQFSIPKRHGGMREISAPYPSLMSIQKWIYREILFPKYQFPSSVSGFVKGKSIRDNASPHCGHDIVLQMDIKDFFPSITLNRVVNVFKILGYHNQMAYSLARLCCKDGALPQGSPASPILSNIIAGRMDRRLCALCNKFDITYTRYADDLTFSGKYIGKSFTRIVTKIISDEGFAINESKTRHLRKYSRKILTGVSISSGKPTIPRSLKRRLRQESFYIHKYGIENHKKFKGIKDSRYKMRLNGYLAYWKSIEDCNTVRKLFKQLNSQQSVFQKIIQRITSIFKR